MSGWSSSSVTNTLLGVISTFLFAITILLVVIAVQLGSDSTQGFDPHASTMGSSPHAPMTGGGMPPAGGSPDFNHSDMVLASLLCPDDATLVLTDPGCSGKEADKRKALVNKLFDQGASIRAVFDAVVKSFGLKALTVQAREIMEPR